MAYQKIGFKNGDVLTAEQLIHMEDGIVAAEKKPAGGGAGTGLPSDVGAYKYMATDGDGKWVPVDRLAYETKTVIAWDGDTTGRVVVADMFCKVSDIVPKNLIGSLVWLKGDSVTVTESEIQSIGGVPMVAQHYIVVENDNTTVEGVFTFPEKGVYQNIQDGDGYYWELFEVVRIDPKFIPSDSFLKTYNFPSQIASAEEANKAIAEMKNYQLVSVGGVLCAYETYEGTSASYFYPIHANGVNPLEYFDTGYFGNNDEYPIDTSYLQNFTKKYHTLPEIYLRASDGSKYKVTIDGTGTLVSTKM